MKKIVYYGPGQLVVEDGNKEEPSYGMVRVKVKYASICGSDLTAYKLLSDRFAPPLVLGHEFSGIIDSLGENVVNFNIGEPITAYPILYCGKCWFCERGLIHLCINKRNIGTTVGLGRCDGAFSEYINLPEHLLIRLGEGMNLWEGALIEPLAVAIRSARNGNFQPGETTAIIGTGPIGLLVLLSLKVLGSGKIICSDTIDNRLDLSKKLGADIVVNPLKEDVIKVVKDATNGRGADRTIVCNSSAKTFNPSLYLTRSGGSLVLVGVIHECINLNPMDFFARDINIYGSYMHTNEMYEAIELVASRKINLKDIVSSTFPLEETKKAFDILSDPNNEDIKILLKM